MLTKDQIRELAGYYRIHEINIVREYIQLTFLSYLYMLKEARQIYFKGGTAIHLIFGSPRFSEDLDFSTSYSTKEIRQLVKKLEKNIRKELPSLKILPLYSGKKGIRYKIIYQDSGFKYPFVIRLDITHEKNIGKIAVTPLPTRFPVAFFPVISHLPVEEILAEKIRAVITRAKGRDLFDLWFLLEKGIKPNIPLIEKKLKSVGKEFDKNILITRIKDFPVRNLKLDIDQFLSRHYRDTAGTIKDKILEILR